MGNVLITLIIKFVMLKIDIVTQLGRQLMWTYPHLSLALRPANVHFLQVALDQGTTKIVPLGVSLPFLNLKINYTRNT